MDDNSLAATIYGYEYSKAVVIRGVQIESVDLMHRPDGVLTAFTTMKNHHDNVIECILWGYFCIDFHFSFY
jgi:hypothetical protein